MFVRFVAGTEAENAYRLDGVFVASRLLREEGRLYAHEIGLLDETYAWFNEYLPCPPFAAKLRSGEWTRDAVAWFRDDAGEPLRRIWDLVHLLRENGVPVRLVAAGRPGKIVYRDPYQVVAETPYWA
jgi:hypothetical protein